MIDKDIVELIAEAFAMLGGSEGPAAAEHIRKRYAEKQKKAEPKGQPKK